MIKVIYNKTCGRCVQSEPLTSGMVGQTIELEYSADFDGLTLTAVFTNGKTTVDVLNPGNQCMIPHEVLDTVGTLVKVGIYAVRGNELVIPTIYAHIGFVLKGADPNGGISEDPTLPVWAQTQAMIGNLNALETEAKENLVLAINEVKHTADSKQDAISDLEAIRSGASKGATALQSVPNSYRTAAAQDIIDNAKQDKLIAGENITIAADGKTISATGGGSNLETVESQLVDVPSKLSQFTNDAGYLTLDTLPKYDGSVIAE